MAAKKSVQFGLDFNVQNANTIEELENTLEQINQEIRSVDKNSDAFKSLSAQARQADGKLRTVNQQLEGVTSLEKSEGILKLGEGLAGAFEVAAGASLLFGEQTSEQLQEVIAQVGGLVTALDGVRRVTEALSAQNLRYVKGAIDGFKRSAVAAKLFGNTTRKALTATGIGAIVVLIGTLIANFDKVKEVASNALDSIKNSTSGVLAPLRAVIDFVDGIIEKFGSLKALVNGVGAAIRAAFTFGEDVGEAFDQAVQRTNEIQEIEERRERMLERHNRIRERGLKIMEAQEGTEKQVLNLKESLLEEEKEILQELKLKRDLTNEEKKRLEDIKFELQLIAIERDKINEQETETEKKAEQERQKALEQERQKTKQLRRQIEERQLANKELQIEYELSVNLNALNSARLSFSRDLLDNNVKINDLKLDELLTTENINDIIKDIIDNDEQLIELRQYRQDILEDENLTTKEREKILNNISDAEIEYLQESGDLIQNIGQYLNENEKQRLANLEAEKLSLNVQRDQNEVVIDSLKRRDSLLQERRNILTEELQTLGNTTEEVLRQEEIEGELLKIRTDRKNLNNDLIGLLEQNLDIKNRLNDLTEREKELIGDVVQELTGQIGIQNTALQDLEEKLSKIGEELRKYGTLAADALSTIGDLFTAFNERQLQAFERQIQDQRDLLEEFYDYQEEREEELQEQKEENREREEELVELLRDAEGDRYDDIQAEIERVRAAESARAAEERALMQQKAKMEYDLAVLEWQQQKTQLAGEKEAAKYEKASAAIMATIQTTLAVIEALPNIALSVAVGVLGAAGTAAILAQPLPSVTMPPKPTPPELGGGDRKRAEDGGLLVGASHRDGGIPIEAEGGEYIINKRSTAKYLPLLESINTKFQEGGLVSPTVPEVDVPNQDFINYDRLAEAMSRQKVVASWTEGKAVGRKVDFTQSRSSI